MSNSLFNALHIGSLFKRCLWKRGELDTMRIAVLSGEGKECVFHRRKIEEIKGEIGRILLANIRSDMMRSVSDKGRPWMLMRSDREGLPMGMMENVDKLFALAQACEFVSVRMETVEGLENKIPFVIVEDIRIRNRMKRLRSRGV